jgi:hypothetical protein
MIGRLGLLLFAVAALAGTASAAGSDPRDPKKRFNSADQAWARAIRIDRADLGAGDWRVEQSPDDDSDAPAGCKNPNLSDLVLTGEAKNPDFSRKGSFVGSGAEVWSGERHAAIAWRRNTSIPIGKCLTEAFKQGVGKDPRVKLTVLSSGPIRIGKLAPRALTYGMRFRIKGPAATLNGRLAFYVFSRGRADGMLMVVSFDPPLSPVSQALERRLAALVAKGLTPR